MHYAKRIGLPLFSSVLVSIAASPAGACSICRCGDPTFNALGSDGVGQAGFRAALDRDDVGKTQGDPADEHESMSENRTTLLLAYGVNDRLGLFARLPYSERELTEHSAGGTERSRASGMADPEFSAQVRLWSSPFEGDVGARASLFVVGGVKTPWGQNDIHRNGARLDEHLQPGTGSTDVFGGLAGSYQINPRSALFSSVQYRATGRNDVGYKYGNAFLANLEYEHKLGSRLDAVIGLNYRNAGRDEIDPSGAVDNDTGGTMLFVTPQLLVDLGHGWVVRGSVQVPMSQSGLNGHQHEDSVYNVGVTFLARR